MNDRISALMDGEVDQKSAAQLIEALTRDAEAVRTWRNYHLIGDAMRGGLLLSEGFTERLAQRLAAEPTVLAPRRIGTESPRLFTVSAAAASLAAVAFVGWMAFAPQTLVAPASVAPTVAQIQAPVEAKPVLVPLPNAANDYLLAHQGFSPRVSLQGMAPYVLTVAEHPAEARK
jgi:sigma-E factor negative regulatory protein RseA